MSFPCGTPDDHAQIAREEYAEGLAQYRAGLPYYSGASAAWRAGWRFGAAMDNPPPRWDESECGGAFDGFSVSSDADSGL